MCVCVCVNILICCLCVCVCVSRAFCSLSLFVCVSERKLRSRNSKIYAYEVVYYMICIMLLRIFFYLLEKNYALDLCTCA